MKNAKHKCPIYLKKDKEESFNKSVNKLKKIVNFKLKIKKEQTGITLIALAITILFSYDEKIKCSNSKGFLLTTI